MKLEYDKYTFDLEQGNASDYNFEETKKVIKEVFEENVYEIYPYDFKDVKFADVIKIDIEGAEYEVIEVAIKFLGRSND